MKTRKTPTQITQKIVDHIVFLNKKMRNNKEIAEELSLSEGSVSQIINGRKHYGKMLPENFIPKITKSQKSERKLSDEQVIEIRKKYLSGVIEFHLAQEYDVPNTTIGQIIKGKSYRNVGIDKLTPIDAKNSISKLTAVDMCLSVSEPLRIDPILEFMGYTPQNDPNKRFHGKWYSPTGVWVSEPEKQFEDWNHLMLVVDEIETLDQGVYQVDILQEGCRINHKCKGFIDKTVSKVPDGTTKKESILMAVTEFATYYNNLSNE